LVFALLLASVSALSRLQKLRRAQIEAEADSEGESEWDIAEGISGAALVMGKVEGHELTVREAYARLTAAEKATITNPVKPRPFFEAAHNPVPLIMGVQFPDMPMGGANVAMLGDDLTSPTHVNVATFGTLFKAGELGARNSFVAHTHYGCLQFWHAMAPEPYVGGKYKVWTNAVLSQLIKNSVRRIWTVAVGKLRQRKKDLAEFHLGRILHTIGDSYAPGHTFRDGACGKIIVFQEYNAQKGNKAHGNSDKPKAHTAPFACAVSRITEVLKKWSACAKASGTGSACDYPAGVIDPTFDPHPTVASGDAGGSIEKYAGEEAKTKGIKKAVTVGATTVQVYFPATKGLQRVAGTADVGVVCPRF
jgi:hypothetical protein